MVVQVWNYLCGGPWPPRCWAFLNVELAVLHHYLLISFGKGGTASPCLAEMGIQMNGKRTKHFFME